MRSFTCKENNKHESIEPKFNFLFFLHFVVQVANLETLSDRRQAQAVKISNQLRKSVIIMITNYTDC